MTAAVRTGGWLSTGTWRRLFRDRPVIPLLGLLAVLVALSELVRPGIVSPTWIAVIVRASVPLAILAGCQTLTMLTGGIDLSVGAVASMSGFVVATLVAGPGTGPAIVAALVAAAIVGLVTGIGVGVFRVHPLIMTLGMSLVVLGLANVWQLQNVKTNSGVSPQLRSLGSGLFLDVVPYSLIVFVPLAVLILVGLRRTGYGRLLYAIGDNPIAARLSGARGWQVLIVLYVISAVLAAIAGLLYSGLTNVASVALVDSAVLPSVAAAVIGGTSIMGGRGGYVGTIVGALILTVVESLLSSIGYPEAVRQVLFGAIIVAVAAAYTRVTGEILSTWLSAGPRAATSALILAGRTSSGSSSNARPAPGARLTATRSRRPRRTARTRSSPASRRWASRRWAAVPASRRSGSASRASTTRPPARHASWSICRGSGPGSQWRAPLARCSGCRRS